jgi:hypothetical protein
MENFFTYKASGRTLQAPEQSFVSSQGTGSGANPTFEFTTTTPAFL